MQLRGKEGFDPGWCFDTPVVHRPFLWERELGYFVRAFLQGYLGLKVEVDDLAPDFERLLTRALPPAANFFLHRDFQSRNLMIKNGRLRVIDFRGDVSAPWVTTGGPPHRSLRESEPGLAGRAAGPLSGPACRAAARGGPGGLYRAVPPPGPVPQPPDPGGVRLPHPGETESYFARYLPTAVGGLRRRLAEREGEFPLLEQVAASLKLG